MATNEYSKTADLRVGRFAFGVADSHQPNPTQLEHPVMKLQSILVLCLMGISATAWAERWDEVYRDKASDAQGASYFIDRDSLKIKRGIVFFRSKAQGRQTQKFSKGSERYDYQIGSYAVDCRDKTMAALGNAFYLTGGRLVGELPVDEGVVFDKSGVNKALFDKIEVLDSPWAGKINYTCAWFQKQGKAKQ